MINILIWFFFLQMGWGAEVQLQVDSDAIYSGVPFVLSIVASDFEENPEPVVGDFEIPGCTISYMGVSPSVSTQVSIINGRRSMTRDVRFVFQYRIEAPNPGNYTIPVLKVSQGSTVVQTRKAQIKVNDVSSTRDLAIKLVLPTRSVRVGETIPIYVDLYLRKNINDQVIVVPLFDRIRDIAISAPEGTGRRTLSVSTAAGDLELPFEKSNSRLNGMQYTRFRLTAEATMLKAGTLNIEPSQIVAQLPTGRSRDRFGFPSQNYKLFKAQDKPQSLTIQPLPLQGRPDSFAGAVGQSFSMEVRAKKTVVKVGEPIELEIQVRGKGELSGLQLPNLYSAGLDKREFDIATEKPIGKDMDDGGKRFETTVQITKPTVRELPSLEFSYFDPETGKYSRAHSEPIALSVEDSVVVTSNNVITRNENTQFEGNPKSRNSVSLTGADLSLSDPSVSRSTVLSHAAAFPISIGLYLFSILLTAFVYVRRKTEGARQVRSGERKSKKALLDTLRQAKSQPAKEASTALSSALRVWSKQQGLDVQQIITNIELEAYAPQADSTPISSALLKEIEALVENPPSPGLGTTPVVLLLLAGLSGYSGFVNASDTLFQTARDKYSQALSLTERGERIAAFTEAAAELEQLVDSYPAAPELITDWGNAAIGAADRSQAAFAYHHALLLNPRLRRAEQNRDWLEKQLPAWARSDQVKDPLNTLLIWPTVLNQAEQMVLGALLFFLLVTLRLLRKPQLQPVIIVIGLIWASTVVSVLMEESKDPIAIVQPDAGPLRAADNSGAPAVTSDWVPDGTAVRLIRTQDLWAEVSLASGIKGWLPTRAIKRVQ